MAEALDPTFGKKEFHNWLKGAMSVLFAKEGLSEFVQSEFTDFHTDLKNSVIILNGLSPGTTCTSCTTENVLSCPTAKFCSKGRQCNKHDKTVPDKTPNIQCRNNLCNGLKDGIRNMHRYNQPSWQNSDATKWYADTFEVAKCFMPPDGYSGKRSLADTDFNGIIAMIINNKRFQNKMTTQLNTQHNSCSKARDIVNATIRHSGSNELSDLQLARCIDALRDVLVDSKFLLHDQHAQAAVNKLNQLQNNTLTISSGDITGALEENIRDCLSQHQQEAVQAIKKYLDTVQTTSVAALENIKSAALDEIRKTADDKIQELLQLSQQQHTHSDDVFFDNLKEEMITYYREHESVIPASPLVDEHNIPIEDLYVLPPMLAYTNSYFEKQKITISQLFVSGDVRYKKIYITANAGFGKTSLSQKLTMIWCQSHAPLASLSEKYEGEELAAMKYFDLLFLVHLEDYRSDSKCNLDDLIMKMVSENMSRKSRYTHEFIERILHEKKCLVILDGLEKWSHPGRCTRKPEIPHNNHPGTCTVLTTTTDWKIVGLSPKHIDRRVEISILDAKSRRLLKTNAIGILNKRNVNLAVKNFADFDNKDPVKSLKISDSDEKIAFMQYLNPGGFTHLETLTVEHSRKEPVCLADIVTESARTLNCLTISLGNSSLSDISITALTGLTCLQTLYLAYVEMTHINLECLYAYISKTTTLTKLKLHINCSDHKNSNCDVNFDIHRLNELKILHLDIVPLRELRVNPACLEKFVFQPPCREMTAGASATLWQDLRAAPVLSSLELKFMNSCQEMIQTIATLTQLQYLKLFEIDMDMDVISLSPAMRKLERVELTFVKMSSAARRELVLSVGQLPQSITVKLEYIRMTSQEWRELLLSVGGLQHPVTVELYKCKGPSREEWRTIVDEIKTTPTLSLLQDLLIHSASSPFIYIRIQLDCSASLTLKNIPVL